MGWVLIALLTWLLWPSQWGGNTTYVVVKGTSMLPHYHTGDIVVARAADHLEVGDLLVYAVPKQYTGAGRLIMHRLKRIDDDGSLVTQGDNRTEPDQFEIFPDDVRGVAKVHVPKLGLMARLLGRWWFIAGLVGLFAMLQLWPDDEEGAQEGDTEPVVAGTGGDRRKQRDRRRPELEPTNVDEPSAREVLEPAVLLERLPPVVAAPPARRSRPAVIVDGDGLARAGWPDLGPDIGRQLCIAAAGGIAARFGTQVAVVFVGDVADLEDRGHAYVERVPDDGTIASVVQGHVAERAPGQTVLVVTDALDVADQVWAHDGSVMRCAAWLALGETVGATVQ